jgi:8-oxo-dGTP pyrophosphatase MutT (NUDIX family)
VIAYRISGGRIRVLLVTSRDKGRWIIPKGNVDAGHTPAQAAQQEAYEEAGLKGIASAIPLGFYTYFKQRPSGASQPATVEVYLLRVTERLRKFPEKGKRKLSWMSTRKAVGLIQEPGAIPLLWRLAEFEDDLVASAKASAFH